MQLIQPTPGCKRLSSQEHSTGLLLFWYKKLTSFFFSAAGQELICSHAVLGASRTWTAGGDTWGFQSIRSDVWAEYSAAKDPTTTLLEITSQNVSSLSAGGMAMLLS